MKFLEYCDLCSSKKLIPLYSLTDSKYNIPDSYTLVKCERCGLVFLNPQPEWSELVKHYPPAEYLPWTSKKEMGGWVLKKMYHRWKQIHERGFLIKKSGRLLDIGCGNGDFLLWMERQGMECFGVEPGFEAWKQATKRNLNVFNTTLEEAFFPNNYFDVITSNHVLEHVPEPTSQLFEMKRVLKRKGTILISVPNLRSLDYFVLGERFEEIDCPRHLYSFSRDTLLMYIEKVGLKVIRIRYPSLHLHILKDFQRYFGTKSDGAVVAVSLLINFFKLGHWIEIWLKNSSG